MENENKTTDGINFPKKTPDTSKLAVAQRTASMQNAAPPINKLPQFFMPALWDIKADGDNVVATHNIFGDVFKGTRKDFSNLLSGK